MGDYFEGELTFLFELKDDEDSTCLRVHCLYLYNLGRNGGDAPYTVTKN